MAPTMLLDTTNRVETAVFERVLDLYPPSMRGRLRSEWPLLRLQLDRLAGEVLEVETRRIPFAVAVRDHAMSYPLMTKIHHGIRATIQTELTPEMRDAIRYTLDRAHRVDVVADLRRAAFTRAAADTTSKEAALLRFLFYEGLLLNLTLSCWRNPEVEATGTLLSLEEHAQEIVAEWLTIPEAHHPEVRPLRCMIVEGLRWVEDAVRERLAEVGDEVLEEVIKTLIPAIEIAHELEARDGVLLNNEIAGRLGDQKLGPQQIVDRYPLQFQTRAAVDTRNHRLRKKLTGGRYKPRGPRLVDELLAVIEEDDHE